jgi:2-C-methyl-D-erythritol 4-phosphate cytidylyltransferase
MSAGAAIPWKSSKQTIAATSTNQSEIIALYEACRECVWLRQFIEFIRKELGITKTLQPITVYEDNTACVDQVQRGYIKSDRTKHIDPKFFFMHELNRIHLEVKYITSEKNLADLFTKSLGTTKHWNLVHGLGMTKLK